MTLVDELGWGVYVKERLNKPVDAIYYFARWVNVVLLNAFFESTELKQNATAGAVSSTP